MPPNSDSLLRRSDGPVLTDGVGLYVRLRRGVYAAMGRNGTRAGGIHTGFTPRPRWRLARLCNYDAAVTLWCPRCGSYDVHYARTGERSFCGDQMTQAQHKKAAAA